MTAGGDVVMKSKASPLTPIPSLSIRKRGRVSSVTVLRAMPRLSPRISAYSVVGMMVDISAPVVVVPTEPEPVVNIEWLPDRRDVTVDFPTPLAPTIETRVSCLLSSGMLWAR